MKRLVLSIVICLVGLSAVGWRLVGLRRSEVEIRESLLAAAPLDSDREVVVALIKSKGWKSGGVRLNAGFLKQERLGKSEVVGVSSIHATLGEYWTFPFLTTDVSAYWGFDDKGRLVDVWVWKTIDAP